MFHSRLARRCAVTGVLFALAGAALALYPAATDVHYQRLQTRLAAQLESPELNVEYVGHRLDEGDSVTRLVVPSIGVDTVVVEGTSSTALRAGAGHYPSTPLPGEVGNVAIAGHRTTYGRPFADLDRLEVGDDIVLLTPLGRFTYRVTEEPFVVADDDWRIVEYSPAHLLTLSTCHPKGSARQRLVVRAELVRPPLFGA